MIGDAMKLPNIAILILLTLTQQAFANTTKLVCKNKVGGSTSGPLELDLNSLTAYRYQQREPWKITSVTPQYITMMIMKDVGGGIAVLDLVDGELKSVDLSRYCDSGVANCTEALAKLQGFDISPQLCTKGLLSQ